MRWLFIGEDLFLRNFWPGRLVANGGSFRELRVSEDDTPWHLFLAKSPRIDGDRFPRKRSRYS